MHHGIFITFEGPEGAGKSTAAARLAAALNRQPAAVAILTREPGGTALAEQLRDLIKHYDGPETVADATEVLLIEAGRAQHVARVIRPALERGATVLCDRFTDSTLAYQGGGRGGNLEELRRLNDYATGGLTPDLTLLFDLPPEVGLARAADRGAAPAKLDRLESQQLNFHLRVRDTFASLARREPERFRVLDATLPPDELFERVLQEYHALLSRI